MSSMDWEDDFSVIVNVRSFYFLHASEQNNYVHLHGKLKLEETNSYKQCTIKLSPVTRTLYVKARHSYLVNNIGFEQKSESFKNLVENSLKHSIQNMQTYSSTVVQMQTIHSSCMDFYLKINYHMTETFYFDNNNIPDDSCISYIYGLKQSALETFLVEKGIKGPCWLEIETYGSCTMTLSSSQLDCHPENVSVMANHMIVDNLPPLKIAFLDVANVTMTAGQIEPLAIAVGCAKWNGKCYSPSSEIVFSNNHQMKNALVCRNSFVMLENLRDILRKEAVDLIITFDKQKFKCSSQPYIRQIEHIFHYYIMLDLKHTAWEFFPELLCEEKHLFDRCLDRMEITSELMFDRISKCQHFTDKLDVISAYMFIANVTGCSMKDVVFCGIKKRVETMLRHEMQSTTIMIPEMEEGKPAIKIILEGGKIILPKVGYCNKMILAFDFTSLYPSVIQEFGISFTSADKVLPSVMNRLLCIRRELDQRKQKLKSKIAKNLANSVYGCLSSEYSIYFKPHVANKITAAGRDLLTTLESEICEHLQCTVLYGHTDSVFVELHNITDYDEALSKAAAYQESIAASNRHVTLKLEGIFSHALIFNKVMYALRYHDAFPRDNILDDDDEGTRWLVKGGLNARNPPICHQLLHYILGRIIVDQTQDERTKELIATIKCRLISDNVDDYVMRVQLHNSPESYSGKGYHLSIIQRRNLQCPGKYRRNDVVAYVICEDGTSNPAHLRAYDLEELASSKLRIDKDYYREKQILTLLENVSRVAPDFVLIDHVRAFLIPQFASRLCMAKQLAQYLPAQFRNYEILPFYFRCEQCWRFVVVKDHFGYDHFVICSNCATCLTDEVQFAGIRTVVENNIKEYSASLKHAKKLTSVKWLPKEMCRSAEESLINLEIQFFRQLSLWKEVIETAQFTLDWCSDGKLVDHVKCGLRKLFTDVMFLLDKGFNEVSYDGRTKIVDFKLLFPQE